MKQKQSEHIYTLHLTERQAKLLSYTCNQFSRLICGQDWSYQELFEEAWEKRCKEAVGGHGMDKEWDGGWYAMRQEAERYAKEIKARFWGLESNAMFGIHYDDTADILFDVYQVIRHQLWLDTPEENKSHYTVDASEAMRVGDEPLAIIARKENNIKWNNIPKDKDGFFDEDSDLYDRLPIIVAEITDEDVCLHYIDVENWHDTLADLSRSRFKYYIQVEPLTTEK